MIGLKHGEVRLCKHEKAWEENAAETISVLHDIFGAAAVDIQHVGSTAIPSIMAKPIIDIAVGLKSFDDVTPFVAPLRNAGFYYRPHCGLYKQKLFSSGSYYDSTGDLQTHFIHVVIHGSAEWLNYIGFRDYLNEHCDAAKEYEELKLHLSKTTILSDGTRTAYIDGKHDFIMSILAKLG